MTEITAQNLVDRGYKRYKPIAPNAEECFYQKRFDDECGKKYFIEFREWDFERLGVSYDTRICCYTDSDGYIWCTIREDTIEQAEQRAIAIWQAAGSVYYEKYETETP